MSCSGQLKNIDFTEFIAHVEYIRKLSFLMQQINYFLATQLLATLASKGPESGFFYGILVFSNIVSSGYSDCHSNRHDNTFEIGILYCKCNSHKRFKNSKSELAFPFNDDDLRVEKMRC